MKAVCNVCMHHCRLEPGQKGICLGRRNEGGAVVCANYGMVTSLALDPIEKKPLNMFRPGSLVLSAGSFGCNLKCPFCQNHEISMADGKTAESTVGMAYIPPEGLAAKALEYQTDGNIGVAFTYNEPLIGWEYVRDTARLVKEYGMDNVLVTNGSVLPEILEEVLPYIELTTLIVPGENDGIEEMEEEAKWIASLGREIPLHVTRFFPQYRMTDRGATDVGHLYRLAETAGKYLEHVFAGNVS